MKELDGHHTTRFEKDWHDLGSSVTAIFQLEKAGVDVWPNVSLIRTELKSKVRTLSLTSSHMKFQT